MSPYTLGRAACVCRKWKYTARNPTLWRAACLKTWQVSVLDFVIQFHVLTFLKHPILCYEEEWNGGKLHDGSVVV